MRQHAGPPMSGSQNTRILANAATDNRAMLPDLIFVSLATTGPNPDADEVFEYAAIRVKDGKAGETFARLARIEGKLPLHVKEATGLSDKELSQALTQRAVRAKFTDFIAGGVTVCWDEGGVGGFVASRTRRPWLQMLDLRQVATIVLPTARSYDLDELASQLGLDARRTYRAEPDARLLAEVYAALCERAKSLSLPVASEVARVCRAGDPNHPLTQFFEAVERAVIPKSLGAKKKIIEDCVQNFGDLIRAKKPEREHHDAKLDADELAALFEPEGVLGRSHPLYERRQEQIDMVTAVCKAFSTSTHLMVEAGTGTGKSMAYIVPAIMWSKKADTPVVVSTNTKNLQEQLFRKDLPYLHEHLGVEFKSALIKGRGNYLCVRKLLYVLREAERELTADERVAFLPVVSWFDGTESGDLAECAGFAAGPTYGLRERITSTGDDCRGRSCPYGDSCFVRRARALAQQADIIVANHSVVFAELGQDSPVLPPYDHLVLDEAHNIEDVATEFLARRMSRMRVVRILNRLYRPTRDGSGSGLLSTILAKVRVAEKLPEGAQEALDELLVSTFQKATDTAEEAGKFVELFEPLYERKPNEEKLRFKVGYRDKEKWEPIARGKRTLIATTAALANTMKEIRDILGEVGDERFDGASEFCAELTAAVDALREVFEDVEFILRASDPNYVYWVERRPWGDCEFEVCAAPIEIADMMVQYLFNPKKTVIMCSATLTVDDSFDFMKERVGAATLDRTQLATKAVGSPFDYDSQALVAVPQFLPDPGSPNKAFEDGLAELLVNLFRTTQGRGLVLFTSYAMLNYVYDVLKKDLERDGILVLAQGKDGQRTHLARVFHENTSSVLLGTQSFWEGVDFVGESLSCLVVVKLPFAVFTDPLIEARCEHIEAKGQSAFFAYSVPSAAIKFRQGFGRLIRTKTDRGVIVATDKRVITRRYGDQFLRSLPTQHRLYADEKSLLDGVKQFFEE